MNIRVHTKFSSASECVKRISNYTLYIEKVSCVSAEDQGNRILIRTPK